MARVLFGYITPRTRWLLLSYLLVLAVVHASDYAQDYGDDAAYGEDYNKRNYQYYQDYGDPQSEPPPDNLYADYVEGKAVKGGTGPGWGTTAAVSAVSWFLGGKIHAKRATSQVKKQAAKEKQELYLQYYQDVLTLQNQNAELASYIEQLSKQQKETEFDAADLDSDNMVSRAEFNRYKNAYLQKHPEMKGQFPNFEDFDPDSNGYISKKEYDAYYAQLGL